MENKLKYKYQSEATSRQSQNPYAPFQDYNDYCNWIILQAVELNEIASSIPAPLVAEIWIHDIRFRQTFKRMAYMAYCVHYEDTVQRLLPWCNVNIRQYCQRFDDVPNETIRRILL